MVNTQILQGNWNQIKGKLQQRWGDLTDDEVRSFSGDVDQLVGLIQEKTGQSRDEIEEYLDEISGPKMARARQSAAEMAESARQYGRRAAESISGASQSMAESLREGYGDAEEMVREHPMGSMGVVFGAGMLLGIFAGMILRR